MTGARGLAIQLGHHPPHVHTLGDAVPVAAVRAGHVIVVSQIRAHANGHRLLAGGGVAATDGLAGLILLGEPVLESADERHASIEAQ